MVVAILILVVVWSFKQAVVLKKHVVVVWKPVISNQLVVPGSLRRTSLYYLVDAFWGVEMVDVVVLVVVVVWRVEMVVVAAVAILVGL